MRRIKDYTLISEARLELLGLAIFGVYFYHAGIYFPISIVFALPRFLRNATVGVVDIMFFISAYGLVFGRLGKPFSWPDYLYRRFARILPSYWLVIAVAAAVRAALGQPFRADKLLLDLSTLGFWLTGESDYWYFPALFAFYLAFPFLFNWYEWARDKTRFVALIVVGCTLLSLAITPTPLKHLLIFTIRIPAFVMGLHIGYVAYRKSPDRKNASFLILGIALAISAVYLALMFQYTSEQQRWAYGLWWYPYILGTLPVTLILSWLISESKKGSWERITRPVHSALVFLGTYSLEIYLIHVSVLQIDLFRNYLNSGQLAAVHANRGRLLEGIIYFAITMALVPVLNKLAVIMRQGVGRLPRVAAATVVLLLIGAALGAVLQASFGLDNPARVAVRQNAIEIPAEYRGKLSLFILAGQSNIGGKGDLKRVTVKNNGRVFTFGNDYRWHLAVEPVDDPTGQIDQVSQDIKAGAGPSLAFGVALAERDPSLVVGLIPCAMEETTISRWERNLSDHSLYGSCLKRARAASTMGRIAGLLFFQGEADTPDPTLYPRLSPKPTEWAGRFEAIVAGFRTDLAQPDLPVVFAQIGPMNHPPEVVIHWKTVQEQQRSVHLPYCAMITTDDLTLQDEDHFTTESYEIIGRRFAEAYWKLMHP